MEVNELKNYSLQYLKQKELDGCYVEQYTVHGESWVMIIYPMTEEKIMRD